MSSQTDYVEVETSPRVDSEGAGESSRTFKIWGATENQITRTPTSVVDSGGTPLPAYLSPDPRDPSMILDRWQIDGRDGNVIVASALYSSDRRFVFRDPMDPADPNTHDFNESQQTEPIELLYAKLTRFTATSGGLTQHKRAYVQEAIKSPHKTQRVTLTVVYQGYGLTQSTLIAAQVDKLHRLVEPPNERWYLFEGATSYNVSAEATKITYTWWLDPGTGPIPRPSEQDGGKYVIETPPMDKVWHGRTYTRPPYHALYMTKSVELPDDVPTFGVLLLKEENMNGHLTLPGLT